MSIDTDRRLCALETTLANLVRVGEVTAVYPDKATARVRFRESEGLVTAELPVLTTTAHKVKSYHMPDVGEPVLCVFLPRGRESGFILGALYTRTHTPPVASGDKRHIAFDDGTWIEYDRAAHRLTGHVEGSASLEVSGDASLDAGGNVLVQAGGNIHAVADGDLAAEAGGSGSISVGASLAISAPGGVTVDAPTLAVTGAVTGLSFAGAGAPAPAAGGISGKKVQDDAGDMGDLREKYNQHGHTDSQGGQTSTPSPQM